MADPKIGDQVWIRMGRMYGDPPQEPVRGMISIVHPSGRVDIEIGCDGVSSLAGEAHAISHRDSLPPGLVEQMTCWWIAEARDGKN